MIVNGGDKVSLDMSMRKSWLASNTRVCVCNLLLKKAEFRKNFVFRNYEEVCNKLKKLEGHVLNGTIFDIQMKLFLLLEHSLLYNVKMEIWKLMPKSYFSKQSSGSVKECHCCIFIYIMYWPIQIHKNKIKVTFWNFMPKSNFSKVAYSSKSTAEKFHSNIIIWNVQISSNSKLSGPPRLS